MKIGIDIDDTTTNSIQTLRKFIKKYGHNYGENNDLENNEFNIIRGFLKDEISKKFFHDYCIQIGKQLTIKEDAKEIIDKLHEEGNEIIFITARSDNYYKNAQEYCENYLKSNNIYFDKLITSQLYKVKTCKEENIDIMIDDAIDTCESLRKEGIKSLVFNSEINKDRDTICDRVNNWNELYNYIHNL